MIAGIVRAVVPFADEAGCVARALEQFGNSHFAQRKAVEAARLERVDYAGAMRIAACHQRGSRRRADGGRGIMLGEADAVAHEMVERGRSRRAVVEASEVAVAHVVGKNEDDVRAQGHAEFVAQKDRGVSDSGQAYGALRDCRKPEPASLARSCPRSFLPLAMLASSG